MHGFMSAFFGHLVLKIMAEAHISINLIWEDDDDDNDYDHNDSDSRNLFHAMESTAWVRQWTKLALTTAL